LSFIICPLDLYNKLENKVFGKKMFVFMIQCKSPYIRSISPCVEEFNPRYCKCSITEYNRIQNPFHSIHAIALANLGELTSGLVMLEYLASKQKIGIVTTIECVYFKKANGKITARCDKESLHIHSGSIVSKLYDSHNDCVCQIKTIWTIKDTKKV
jgi:hypothetical protein